MSVVTEKIVSVEEYLELERHSDVRHEYVDGVMHAMAGEKRKHNKLARRLVVLLEALADSKNCEVIMENVKVRTRETRYRYPDIAVSCNPGDDEYVLENPCFILEVLSETTEQIDFSKKLEEYTKIPTVQRYVLLEPFSRFAVLYKRQGDSWVMTTQEANGEIDIPCLETTLTLEQIYAGIA
jgi:Uma2 family endonuclease